MNGLLKELLTMPEARALLDSTLRGDKPLVTGVSPVHRAMLAAAICQETGHPMLALCGDETEALRLCGDLRALTGRQVTLLRRRDWQLRPSAAASRSWEHQRLAALYASRWRAPASSLCGAAYWTCSLPPWSSRCAANSGMTSWTPWACSM